MGRTPLEDVLIPFGLSRLRFELEGYQPLLRTLGGGVLVWDEVPAASPEQALFTVGTETFRLDTAETLPDGKVRVPGWRAEIDGTLVELNDFFVGRYEVTNAEFKAFVDNGGYRIPVLWDPVVKDGRIVPWEEAMALFVDRTGRPGPSTWRGGNYPEGQRDHPVTGVSWYEAAAYARYMGEALPTLHHWLRAHAPAELTWLLPISNLDGDGTRPVGASDAMSYTGAYDLLGNAREWTATANALDPEKRFILGGGWSDPHSAVPYARPTASALDRTHGNGFRLAIIDDEAASAERAAEPVPPLIASEPPERQAVSDELFEAFGRIFDYDDQPLGASIEASETSVNWTRQRVALDAGYGDARMVLYLYLPAVASPPYQTVVYWPGSAAAFLESIDEYPAYFDFIVQSGRAVAFPVYNGTFERGGGDGLPSFSTIAYRDNAIEGVKDVRRAIDYLVTRPDIDASRLAFFGHSWGAVNAPVVLTREPRLSLAVVYVPVIPPDTIDPAVDPLHALPRVDTPTLMLSGQFDLGVPIEHAEYYFRLLGTAEADKKHVIAPGGHFVQRDLLIRETLGWLDQHYGRSH